MADYDLGRAEGTIQLTYDPSGINSANKGLDTFTDKARNAERNFSTVARNTGIAAGILGAGIVYAANTAIDFEHQISAIGAVSGATESQLEQLRKKALQLGADTAFSASEAGAAMEELVKAGLSVEDVLGGAADATVALAAAGGIDLADAAKIASNAMNVFNLKAADLVHVADLIAGAANSSAIDVNEFGFSLAQAGAVANLVGVSFDDLTTAIALMGNAGIKGSDAGTSLKTMLSNLQPVTSKQKDLMRELGIVTADGANQFFTAEGRLKSLAEVSEILNKALAGSTDAQKQMALETIFGSDAIRAAAVLTKAGAAGFNELAASIGSISAADVAAQRLDNVDGAIEQLKGSVETAAIQFGTALLPIIRKVAEVITFLANKFSELDPRWQKLIALAVLAGAALLGVIAVVAGIGAAIAGIAAASGALEIFAIIAGVVAALIALGVAFKLAWDRSEGFRNIVTKLVTTIREAAAAFWEELQPAFKAVRDFIEQHIMPAWEKLQAAFEKARPTIEHIAGILITGLGFAIKSVGAFLGWLIPILFKLAGPTFDLLITVISWLISNIPTFVKIIKTIGEVLFTIGKIISIAVIAPFYLIYKAGKFVFDQLKKVIEGWIAFFSAVWDVIGPVVMAAFGLIKSIVETVMAIVAAIIAVAWAAIKATWDQIDTWIVQPTTAAFNFIRGIIETVMSFIGQKIKDAWAGIKVVWDAVYGFIVPPIVAAFNTVRDAIKGPMEEGQSIVEKVWAFIVNVFTAARDRVVAIIDGIRVIVDKIRNFFNQLRDAANGGTDSLIDFVSGIPGRIIGVLASLGSMLYNAGRNILFDFLNGLKSAWGSVTSWMTSKLGDLRNLLPFSPAKEGPFSGRGWTMYSGQALVGDFADGMAKAGGQAEAALAGVLGNLSAQMPTDFSSTVAQSQALTSTLVPANLGALAAQANQTSTRNLSVGNINLNGVWDFADPTAARKIVATIHGALNDYEGEYK